MGAIDSPHGRSSLHTKPRRRPALAAPSRVVRTHYLTRVLASHSLIMSVRPVKNLFELCRLLPNYGVGFKLKRNSWKAEDCYWTLSKTAPTMDGRHGKAYGKLTWKGVEQPTEKKIRGVLKRPWSYVK